MLNFEDAPEIEGEETYVVCEYVAVDPLPPAPAQTVHELHFDFWMEEYVFEVACDVPLIPIVTARRATKAIAAFRAVLLNPNFISKLQGKMVKVLRRAFAPSATPAVEVKP